MSTKELGDKGERLACGYLVEKGYKILCRNYRINFGEIDIVAKKRGLFADKTIHFVEVKTSDRSENFYPEERAGYKKQNKYRRLIEIWLEKNKYPQDIPCQMNIIAVSINGETPKIEFFENVIIGR
jgi:putative endonuclease